MNLHFTYLTVIIALLMAMPTFASKKGVRTKKKLQTQTEVTDLNASNFKTYYYQALQQIAEEKHSEALETLRFCEKIQPLDGGLQSELGRLYAIVGNAELAIAAWQKAYRSDPKNWLYNTQLMHLYSRLQQFDQAISIAENLKKHFPYREETFELSANLYMQSKQYKKAIAALNKLENIAGITIENSMQKFSLYLELKKNKKAIAEIDRLSSKFPGDMRIRVLRGDIYMYQKLPEKAFEIYNQVQKTEPNNPFVYLSLSKYYALKNDDVNARANIVKALKLEELAVDQKIEILGEYIKDIVRDSVKLDETETMFKLLVERYPLEEKVYDYYAVFLQFRNRQAEAITMYETMLNIDANNALTWLKIIQLHLNAKSFDQAKAIATKAIELVPSNHQLHFFKSYSESMLSEYSQALTSCKKAIELLKPDEKTLRSDYFAQLGDIYYKMDSTSLAFESYEKALEANPSNIYVMNNYAYYLSIKKINLKKAESMSAKTLEKEPKNSTFLDTYAWIFYQQGNYTLAKFYIERAIDNLDKKQEIGEIYDHYGDILLKTGNEKKAIEMWQKSHDSGYKTTELLLKIENSKRNISQQ